MVDVDFLRSVPLFAELEDAELRPLAGWLVERRYAAGEVVFPEEETGRSLYVVREGRVKVSRWLASGRELILAYHDPPEYFGEMALLDGKTAPATVTAVARSAIVSLDRTHFEELLRRPRFARALLRVFCTRCRDAWSQIELLTHREPETRIKRALHRLCTSHGSRTSEGTWIELKLTHRELANMVGVARETATRAIARLEAEKLIEVRERSFLVPDPERLLEEDEA